MRWSVALRATGDRLVTHEEVLGIADAVAACDGVASGIGTSSYGARLVVDAADSADAVRRAEQEFARAARTAGLPDWPVSVEEVLGEEGVT